MGSRQLLAAALGQLAVLGCGAGVVLTLDRGFYANAVLFLLVGVWVGAVLSWRAAQPLARRAAPTPIGSADDGAERRMLRSLLDQTPAPLLMLHGDGRLDAANRAARAMFKVDDRLSDPPEVLSKAVRDSLPGERRTLRLERLRATDAGSSDRAADHAFSLSVTDVVGPSGPVRLAALVDIQPEIAVAEAAALRDLLSVLSHEIMNSLTPVASLAATAEDLLRGEASDAAVTARDAVATLARRADGLTRFVEAYRTLARLPPPRLASTGIGALLTEAASLFNVRWAGQGVALALSKPTPDIESRLDADLMIQALLNLLSNGAEAALAGAAPMPSVRLAARADGAGVVFEIGDNGAGVQSENREAIFQPFFTTKVHGSGVGLSFALQVARSHGGDLRLASQPADQGARFMLQV